MKTMEHTCTQAEAALSEYANGYERDRQRHLQVCDARLGQELTKMGWPVERLHP